MNHGPRKWIKLWVDPWLSGTLRFTLDHKQRAVWADILALAGQSRMPGVICAGEEMGNIVGFPLSRIAGFIDVRDLAELGGMLELFQRQERIKVEHENGRVIIHIINWSKYQAEYSKQARYKAKKKREKGSGYHVGYQKATSPEGEGEVEVEVEINPCANPSGSHQSAPTSSDLSDKELSAVRRVWDHYVRTLEKNPRILTFTEKRKHKGLARLRECLEKTARDLPEAETIMLAAVDALAASTFHRGDNDRKTKYDSWEENLFRSAEQLEKWLQRAAEKESAKAGAPIPELEAEPWAK